MNTVKVPTRDQVSPESQAIFDQLQKALGKVPNLYATIGYSSQALKGMLGFEDQLNKGVFTVTEREAINLVVSQVNNCDYCLAAHTLIAGMKGISKQETLDFRRGSVADPKLNAVIQLAKSVAENRGKATQDKVEDFLAAGFDNTALIELVGMVVLRSFTNYVYALTEVPVDFPAAEKLV